MDRKSQEQDVIDGMELIKHWKMTIRFTQYPSYSFQFTGMDQKSIRSRW